MSPEVSERSFEEAIECGLLQDGPDACIGDANDRAWRFQEAQQYSFVS